MMLGQRGVYPIAARKWADLLPSLYNSPPYRGFRYDAHRDHVIRCMFRWGMTKAAIARHFNLTPTRVAVILRRPVSERPPDPDVGLNCVDIHVLLPHKAELAELWP